MSDETKQESTCPRQCTGCDGYHHWIEAEPEDFGLGHPAMLEHEVIFACKHCDAWRPGDDDVDEAPLPAWAEDVPDLPELVRCKACDDVCDEVGPTCPSCFNDGSELADEAGDKGEDYWKTRCEEAHALLATALADKDALTTEVANLREAFQGAWETIEYWKKQAEKHRAERDKQFANVVEWHDSLGYLSPGIAAADFKRYKATLKNINLLRLEAENERPGGDAADGWDRAFEEVGRELLAHGIDPEEL